MGILGVSGYPEIMLGIIMKFIEMRREGAINRGEMFDEEALILQEFSAEERKAINIS